MESGDSGEIVQVHDDANLITHIVLPTNCDEDSDTSTAASVIEKAVVSSDLFAYDPAKYSFCKEKSIVNTLNVGGTGTFRFVTEIKEGVYGIDIWPEGTDADYESFVVETESSLPERTQWSNHRPNIGDFVFGQLLDTTWVRGYVTCVLPYLTLAMIDETKLVRVSHLATCEPPLSDMYAYTGVCELTDTTYKLQEYKEYQFRVIGRTDDEKPDEFEILILKGDSELKATIKPWIPMPEQLGIPCTDVDHGTTVCLTSYQSHIIMFVRPLNTLGLARHNFIMETVAKCAEISEFLEHPRIGQMALALSRDGNYYRGSIITVRKEQVELILYDLGSREYVDRKKLKIYPKFLKQLGHCISTIFLRGMPKYIPPLNPIIKLLDNLVENKVPLICTYDGVPCTEGVVLKYPDGESVNNMIHKCIEQCFVKPSSKQKN
ncbi:uncharacterized protein LOC117205771 [Bombus bifarius]|uniref:Uncharacterized protein LOC117205771 n=1 Tax=Bombus bifarius TaxID=103933 RepID=A0A6P8LJ10_9HYME|nr:uncharacterized protein LOC117205771 [Bombus bifarius]XP_033300385.1 uncharacterized protein LOC117205771 [Bombus bifarius]XP_033300386.1 uncharacterized protein LOC117205771 [Bombus bifarius]